MALFDRRNQSRSKRFHHERARTLFPTREPAEERERKRREEPDDGRRRLPMTRGECVDGPRPCPLVSCRHHLYLDVTRKGGIKVNFPSIPVWKMPYSCSLDIADRGGVTLEDAGGLLNVTRERIRQLDDLAQIHFHMRCLELGLTREDLTPEGDDTESVWDSWQTKL